MKSGLTRIVRVTIWWVVLGVGLQSSARAHVPSLQDSPSSPRTVGQEVVLQAETLEFFQAEQRVVATHHVVVESGETRMFADRLEVNTETGVGRATGNVRLLTPEDDVRAAQLDFNLTTEKGLLYDAVGVIAGGYQIEGEEIDRLGPKQFRVKKGQVTTCTHHVPDWAFRAREARVGVGDYVTLKHPSFWIKGVPVFYLPYFIFPIKDERTTGFLPPRVGYSSSDGAVIQSSFFWAISDWVDSTVGLEYFSERGVKPEAELRYALDPLSDGRIEGAFIEDRKDDDTLWRVLLQQRQEFGWGIRGLTQIDLRSDRDITRRFSSDIRQESQVRTVSFGALTKRFANSVLTAEGASFDGIPDSGGDQQFRRLPTLSFNQLSTPLLGVAFYGLDASYHRLSATDVLGNTTVQRLDFFPNLTVPIKMASWLQLTLRGGLHATFYDRQTTNSSTTTREVPDVQAHVEGPAWRRRFSQGQSGQAFIHTIATRLDYRYVPRVSQRNIPGFETLDEEMHFLDPLETGTLIDRIEATNYVRFSVVNHLFASGVWGVKPGEIQQVARLTLSQGVDIWQATASDGNGRALGPFDAQLELALWQRWQLTSMLRVQTNTGDIDASSTRLVLRLPLNWSLSASHYYREDPDVQYVTGRVGLALLDRRLQLGYSLRFDGLSRTLRSQEFGLSYLAQCWRVDMRLRLRNTENTPFFSGTSFFMQFNLFHF